jgi:hypothetical protein
VLVALTVATESYAGSARTQSETPDCLEWQACRDAALAAATREEYETFHDLAWRAIQTGPPRNAELMYLLARAQSLSGRPHDALVMLRRIAELGGLTPEALASEDFRRARALAGWPELEALVKGSAAPAVNAAAAPTAGRDAVGPVPDPGDAAAAPLAETAHSAAPAAAHRATGGSPVEEALRVQAPGFVPSGLAVDAVSGRFLFGAAGGRKVVVVSESSDRAVDLVRAESAAFFDVMALAIDARRGDLWVASADPSGGGAADGGVGRAALHKIQLVSGRPLATVTVPEKEQPARFTDVAVTSAGVVFALDTGGSRVWRLPPGAGVLDVAARLRLTGVSSMAVDTIGQHAYVAHAEGIARLDLSTGTASEVQPPRGVTLEGIQRLRWHDGSLVAVQRSAVGSTRVVRFGLDRSGRSVRTATTLDDDLPEGNDTPAVVVAGSHVYYTTRARAGNGEVEGARDTDETVVRRARIQ